MNRFLLIVTLVITSVTSFSQVYYGMLDENKNVIGELPLQNDNARINGLEADLGKKLGMVMIFMWYPQTIDVACCNSLIARGITPVITLEAGMSFTSITSGTYDAYFKSIADGLKQINGTVILRYNHEMNGNWYSWSGSAQGNNATASANYINAWRYVHNLIKVQNGATNALWNWCVNVRSYSSTGSTTETWNEPMDYYPGDTYVDWIGFDSYDKPYSTSQGYQTVDDLFSAIYNTLTTAIPDKPVFVGEFASENMGHESDPHKLDFFSQGANLFNNYPRIHAFSYFNSIKSNSGRWNNYKYNNPTTCTAVFKDNWISNVNVVSGNSGIANLHQYQLLTQTGTLKIEAENYFDQFGIKNETCTEGGLNVGYASTGDYMDYLVDVATTGVYACSFRVASSLTTGKIDIKNQAGTTLASYAQTSSTGGTQVWKTVTINVSLTAGKQKIRLYHSGTGLNINWFELSKSNTPPTVSITAPVTGNTIELGNVITISTTATDVAPGTISSVSFYDGATLLGTDLTSPFSFTWSGATIGIHSITAKATDNDEAVSTSGAVSITVVNTLPTVSITSPVAGSSYISGNAITVSATATDTAPGIVSSVSFYDGATLLGTDLISPYTFTWNGATVGTHSITAKATDNNGAITTSGAVSVIVNAPNTLPIVSITAPVTGSSYTSGTSITLSATATDTAPGTVSSVSFYDGATLLNTDVTSPYSFTWTGATVGTHSITAKATDNDGAVSTSGAVSIIVNAMASDPLTLSYFHLVNSWTKDYMRPTAGGLTATITQYEEAVVPTLDSYQWEFQTVTGTNYYYIVNKFTQKAIQPAGGVNTDNTGLSQTTLTATNRTLPELHWSITASNEAGYYWIQNRKSTLYIRPNLGTSGTGIPIVQNPLNTTLSSFKWSLVKLGDKPVTNARVGVSVAETTVIPEFTKELQSIESRGTIEEIVSTTMYPNPADGVIKLRTYVKAEGTVNVVIYDVVGKPVIVKKYDSRVGWLQENIDVSELKSGNYILKINQGIVFETKKLIKL